LYPTQATERLEWATRSSFTTAEGGPLKPGFGLSGVQLQDTPIRSACISSLSMADNDASLREQLSQQLLGSNAHVDVLTALKDLPPKLYGAKPEGAPHSAWELLEHMRMTLRDLWDYSTNAEYVEKKWPDDYWPASSEPPSKEAWDTSVRALKEDLAAFGKLVKDPESNLYAQIPWGAKDHTLLREVLIAAIHNSYHIGELVFLRRTLGAWES
jgi:hypothetical protein